jgi:hypothetical protein
MKAVQLKQVDMDYRNHLQAFLNFAVKAERQAGKGKSRPVYTKFEKFYDYEKAVEKVTKKDKEKSRFAGLYEYLKRGCK